LGFAFYVVSVKQVADILESFEGKYKGSVHTVYAYRLQEDGVPYEKFDNDKEPVGSAGQPILYLLQKKDIMNCLIVVVRYFGGVLLGTGGLVRAYTQAAQETLENNLCLKK
jgi:putative IMPACT (imprinted ancient) family translation regulator